MTQATCEFASSTLRTETFALDGAERFYVALNRTFAGDLDAMKNVWSRRNDVAVMCPSGGRQVGYESLSKHISRDKGDSGSKSSKGGGFITPVDLLVRVKGDLAYSIAIERGEFTTPDGKTFPVELRGTNILERDGDLWRTVYHHSDPLAEMQAASGSEAEFETLSLKPDASVLKAIAAHDEAVSKMFTGDVDALARLWLPSDDVTFGGPEGNWKVGYEKVRDVIEKYSRAGFRGTLKSKDALIRVSGDVAYASYTEYFDNLTYKGKATTMKGRSTSIFTRDSGTWLLIHHHSDYSPDLSKIIEKPGK